MFFHGVNPTYVYEPKPIVAGEYRAVLGARSGLVLFTAGTALDGLVEAGLDVNATEVG